MVIEILTWPVGFMSRPYHAIGGETISLLVAIYAYVTHRLWLNNFSR